MGNQQQKLGKRNTYTPTNLQVCSSVAMSLNREETLSEHGLKTFPNNLDATQQHHTVVQTISGIVYVMNREGKALMPTTSPKARKLLKKGLAKVVKRKPFVIQLLVPCRNETQKIICKIDSGYKNIGFSCTTDKKELFCGEVVLENKTSKRLTDRKMYRRSKRNRLWYRKPRFNNRTRPEGWLPPSIERNYQTHLSLINRIGNLLPITRKIIEVGNFDIQKLENPEIEGTEYQQGSLYRYQNMKHFVFSREKGRCQLCGKDAKDKMVLHHLKQRKDGGTNKPTNIALLHEKCHDKLHKEGLNIKFTNKEYKGATFMNIIKWRFKKDIDCLLTFGYKTFCNRLKLGLEKTHYNDAFCIENTDNNIIRCLPTIFKQKRVTNRCCQLNRKGYKPSIRRTTYKIQPKDSVWIKGKEFIVNGMMNLGKTILLSNKKTISINKIEKYFSVGGLYV